MNASHSRRAFTLVELLVVIGVIAVLVGGLGLSLRGGSGGAALQAGQSSISSLVSAARAQAAVSQAPATVVIWANPGDSATYLRRAAVMLDRGGGKWVIKGEIVDLPQGVFFVPPDLGGNAPAKYETAADWPDPTITGGTYRTIAEGGAPQAMTIQIFDPEANSGSGKYVDDDSYPSTFKGYQSVGIDSVGQISLKYNSTGIAYQHNTLVIANAEPQATGVLFRNAESQRGLYLSAYGIPTIINERAGLKE